MAECRSAREPQAGERAALVGLGLSNRSLATYLARRGVDIFAYDQKTRAELGSNWEEVASLIRRASLGGDYLERLDDDLSDGLDWVFATPGMRKNVPQLQRAHEMGCTVSSELALFMALCPARMIGVTGSSGKTTTATLTADLLRGDGVRVRLGGNIGNPLIAELDDITGDHLVVLEISSFQLELADVVPQLGTILNITPDHLDVHGSMRDYVRAKSRMVLRQRPDDFALLNADCPRARSLGGRAPGRVGFFSIGDGARASLPGPLLGTYAEESLWLDGERICRREELPLRGMHNVTNALAASVLARRAGASMEAIRRGCRSFSPVPHRLEEVAEIDGVLYVNDSIATSPERARAALASYDRPVVLMMGGYDKGLSFSGIVDELARQWRRGRVRAVVLMGATREAIRSALARRAAGEDGAAWDVALATDLDDAFARARERARPGDVVLLSPACASFDAFANYRERGDHFRALVEKVKLDGV